MPKQRRYKYIEPVAPSETRWHGRRGHPLTPRTRFLMELIRDARDSGAMTVDCELDPDERDRFYLFRQRGKSAARQLDMKVRTSRSRAIPGHGIITLVNDSGTPAR